jgi:hypothetical protein
MFFIETMRFENVQNFIIRNNKIIYTNTNNQIFINDVNLEKKAYFFDLYQNQLVYDFKRNITFLDLDSHKEKNITSKSIIKFDGKKYLLLTSKSNQEYCELSCYDFLTGNERIIEKTYYWGIGEILNDTFYFYESNALKSLSLLTGEYEWEVDLAEELGTYDAISKIYGIVNECLWLVTQRGVLLGIKINDGTLIHHLNPDGYDTFQQYGTVQMQYFRSFFDEKQQILIGVYENRYWEIDLKADKPELQITDIKVLNPSYFNNPSFIYEVYHLAAPEGIAYDEQYIYFKDNEVSTVGVLNRQTKQIEWHDKLYELPGRSYVMIRDIQVAANKMYVLDEKGVLHIFEKEIQ